MSDSVRPRRRQPTRLHCPWDSPGKNTGVGCHFILKDIKITKLNSAWLEAFICSCEKETRNFSVYGEILGLVNQRFLHGRRPHSVCVKFPSKPDCKGSFQLCHAEIPSGCLIADMKYASWKYKQKGKIEKEICRMIILSIIWRLAIRPGGGKKVAIDDTLKYSAVTASSFSVLKHWDRGIVQLSRQYNRMAKGI